MAVAATILKGMRLTETPALNDIIYRGRFQDHRFGVDIRCPSIGLVFVWENSARNTRLPAHCSGVMQLYCLEQHTCGVSCACYSSADAAG
jgi:hypothetical protein